MFNKMPTFLQYEFNEKELTEELQEVLSKKVNADVVLDVMDWEDGDFTVSVDEDVTDKESLVKIESIYGELSGGNLTDSLIGDLFGIQNTFNNTSYRQQDGVYYISVRFNAARFKEAWAQADAIQETLDVLLNEQEAWEVREILRQRALAVCKLISDLVPEDMSDYEPVENPRVLTNTKGELVI